MKLLPVFDNGVEVAKDGIRRRNHRILRVSALRAPWSAIEDRVNAWLDSHKDATLADLKIRPCHDGTTSWAAVIQYYEDVSLCPRNS